MSTARARLSIYFLFIAVLLPIYLFCLLGRNFTLRDVDSPLSPKQLMFFPKGFQEGYWEGQDEAEKEIESNTMTMYRLGLTDSWDRLDFRTGLRYTDHGDVLFDTSEGEVRGHNDKVLEHISENGFPPYSKHRWNHELFNLTGYFDSLAACSSTRRLIIGDQREECSPDGKYGLRLLPRETDRYHRYEIRVHDKAADKEYEVELRSDSLSAGYIEYVWGPAGSGFAVFRYVHSFSIDDIDDIPPVIITAALDLSGHCPSFGFKLEFDCYPLWLREEGWYSSRNGE